MESQGEPKEARRSQGEPGCATRSQEEPRGARRSLEEPGGPSLAISYFFNDLNLGIWTLRMPSGSPKLLLIDIQGFIKVSYCILIDFH